MKRVGNSGLGNRGVDNPDCTGIYGEEYDIETYRYLDNRMSA